MEQISKNRGQKIKNYEEMNDAEKLIIDYIQAYAFTRVNSKTGGEMEGPEIMLREIAKELHLL